MEKDLEVSVAKEKAAESVFRAVKGTAVVSMVCGMPIGGMTLNLGV